VRNKRRESQENAMSPKHGLFLALALAGFAVPLGAASPEFRSDDLPGATIHRANERAYRTETIELPLAAKGQPGSRLEYKVHMKAGAALLYTLAASDPVVAEFHGEADANKAVMFYREEKAAKDSHGQFVAPMQGVHGWYLSNEQPVPVTVRLTISGYYELTPGLIPIAKPS
jgi:hypothetical protein